MIPSWVLEKYKARLISHRKDQTLFYEGDPANDFYQVESGQVRMYILSPEGQEFTQGFFNPGESFGEPPLLGNFDYPSTAVMVTSGKIWKLPRAEFIQLLKENFEIHLKLDTVLCKRLHYKSIVLSEVSSRNPEHRLTTILNYHKSKLASQDSRLVVPFTRQQLADMTGLRVETVIRTFKKMEKEGKILIQDRKVLF